MDNPALSQKLKALLICSIGLLFAVFLGTQIGAENYGQLTLGTVVVVLACVSFFSGRFFWVLVIGSSFLGGTFPILGGQFTLFQILMVIGVAKFFVGDVVLRRTKIKFGTRFDVLMIVGFMAILTYHGVHDRFGMRFLGSSVWGGRNYVNVFVGLAAFCVIQSIPMQAKHWAKLPYVILGVTIFDTIIAVITTIFPASIYKIYPFYSAVSTLGIEEVLTGDPNKTGRIGSFGSLGFIIVILILASVSVREVFSLSNFFRFVGLVLGSVSVLYSGFRSAVTNTLIAGFVAGIRDLRWAVLALLPILAAVLFSLSIVNSEFVTLPKQIQRGLTFLPGHWDMDMARDAAASNEFRITVWNLWRREYFPAHPYLGRGFGFRSQWAKSSVLPYGAYETQQVVETGNIHNGLFSTLDAFGLIGTTFFVLWNLRLLGRTFRVPHPRKDPDAMVLRFLALYLAVWIISYWYGAQSVGMFLPQEFAVASVFLRLQRESEITSQQKSTGPAEEVELEESLATT